MIGQDSSVRTFDTLVIERRGKWNSLNLRELVEYRELLYFLALRDIKVRYKQTVLGASWAILQPVFTMLIFSLFFGRLAKIPSDGVAYPAFALCGLVPWMCFANGVSQASNSLVGSSHLITKVYFPRLIIPFSTALAGLVDLLLSLCVLAIVIAYYQLPLGPRVMIVPGLVLLAIVSALGVGLWLSALNVKYRDVRHTVPFLVQLWMFATPVVYPSSLLPDHWRVIYAVNPMVGVVDGFRWSLLGTQGNPASEIGVSTVIAMMLLTSGAFYFRSTEREFADIV